MKTHAFSDRDELPLPPLILKPNRPSESVADHLGYTNIYSTRGYLRITDSLHGQFSGIRAALEDSRGLIERTTGRSPAKPSATVMQTAQSRGQSECDVKWSAEMS